MTLIEFEHLLETNLEKTTMGGPDHLTEAIFDAVFPGGGRVRPQLAFGIWSSLERPSERALLGAAMAVELIHCASLVHDDMPCFDDAAVRRGKPSVHRKYGEDIALLTGDALIVAAFDVLTKYSSHRPDLIVPLIGLLAEAVGAAKGIIAGQASELDLKTDITRIHRLKTGALFEGMAAMTALIAGEDQAAWRKIGARLGLAYQLADDIHDVIGTDDDAGKPVSQDMRHQKPNAAHHLNLFTAARQLDSHIALAIEAIPTGAGKTGLANMLADFAKRLCPESLIPREPTYKYDAEEHIAQQGVA